MFSLARPSFGVILCILLALTYVNLIFRSVVVEGLEVRLVVPDFLPTCQDITIVAQINETDSVGEFTYVYSLLEIIGGDTTSLSSSLPIQLSCFDGDMIRCGQNDSTDSSRLKVSGGQLPDGARLVFGVVINKVGESQTAAANITTTLVQWTPTIDILSPTTIRRSTITTFHPTITSACASMPTDAVVHFLWIITRTNDANSQFTCDMRDCVIPRNVLSPTFNYSISLRMTVTAAAQVVVVENHSTFYVTRSALEASIMGGDRQRQGDSIITISAESSIDPDSTTSTPLIFSWSCTDATGDEPCTIPPSQAGLSVIQFPANTLPGGRSFNVRVTVTTAEPTDTRSSTVGIMLTVTTAVQPPIVALILPTALVNAQRSIRLTSVVISQSTTPISALIYLWTCTTDATILLGSPTVSTPTNASSLSLYPDALLPGHSYTFQLTVTDPASGMASVSSGVIQTALPPSSGSCSLTPETGVAFNTTFTLTCSGWVDPHDLGPITFTVSIMPGNGVSSRLIASQQVSPIIQFLLPVGTFQLDVTIGNQLGTHTSIVLTASASEPIDQSLDAICYAQYVMATTLAQSLSTQEPVQQSIALIGQIAELLNNAAVDSSSVSTCPALSVRQQLLTHLDQLVASSSSGTSTGAAGLIVSTLASVIGRHSEEGLTGNNWDVARRILEASMDTIQIYDPQVTLQFAEVVSSMLTDCTKLDHITTMMSNLLAGAVHDLNPGETSTIFDLQNLLASVERTNLYTGDSSILLSSGVTLPPSAIESLTLNLSNIDTLWQAETLDTRVVHFDSRWTQCRNTWNLTLVSDIVDITVVSSNGSLLTGFNSSSPIVFNIPINLMNLSCGNSTEPVVPLTCSYYDPMTHLYKSAGCSTNVSTAGDFVTCTCTHLTEFTIVAAPCVTHANILPNNIPVLLPQITLRLGWPINTFDRSTLQADLATVCHVEVSRIMVTSIKSAGNALVDVAFTITPLIGSVGITSQSGAEFFLVALAGGRNGILSTFTSLATIVFDTDQSTIAARLAAAVSTAAGDLMRVSLTLSLSIDNLPGGNVAFMTNLMEDIATAAGVMSSRIFLISLAAGSIKASFTVAPQMDDSEISAKDAIQKFIQEANTPNSQLYSGKVTSQLVSGSVQSEPFITTDEQPMITDVPSQSGINVGLIVGVVFGCVGFLSLVALGIWFYQRSRATTKVASSISAYSSTEER